MHLIKKGFTVPIYQWIPKRIKNLEDLLLKQEFLFEYFTKTELISLFRGVKKIKNYLNQFGISFSLRHGIL